jgi:hypothetical protein
LNLFCEKVAFVKKYSAFVLLIIFFLFPTLHFSLLYAQAPDTMWTRTYGGTSSDWGESVQETSDGGFIIAGKTSSFGVGGDVYLIKTDVLGDTFWTKTYGGTSQDYGESVRETQDGGFIIAGETASFGAGSYDVYLIKTDVDGNVLWTKTYGGTSDDMGNSIRETSDGGFIISGNTYSYGAGGSDVYLIKTDASGDSLWTKTYGGINDDFGWSLEKTSDGGFAIAGVTTSFGAGGYDVYLIKTDMAGNAIWTKTYGGTGWEEAYSVQQTSDQGFIITGYTMSYGAGRGDVYLIKTDSFGNVVWSRTYGGAEFDRGWAVQETPDKGYIVAGQTDSFIASLSKLQNPLVLPPPPSDVYVIKTDSIGDTLWTMTVTRTGVIGMDWGLSIDQTSDQGYIITGMTESSSQILDVYLVKIETEVWISEDAVPFTDSHILYVPSFFRDNIRIKLSKAFLNSWKFMLYNISGQSVFEKCLTSASLYLDLNDKRIAQLPSGVYFLSISSDKQLFSYFKLLKISE